MEVATLFKVTTHEPITGSSVIGLPCSQVRCLKRSLVESQPPNASHVVQQTAGVFDAGKLDPDQLLKEYNHLLAKYPDVITPFRIVTMAAERKVSLAARDLDAYGTISQTLTDCADDGDASLPTLLVEIEKWAELAEKSTSSACVSCQLSHRASRRRQQPAAAI